MDRSDINSITTLSRSNFYQKILKKYQTGKKRTFRLPLMIFYDREHILSKKINVNILFQPHLHSQSVVSILNERNIPSMNEIIQWLNNKETLQPIEKQIMRNLNKYSTVKFLKSSVFRAGNVKIELSRILMQLPLATGTSSLYHGNNVRNIGSQISRLERNYESVNLPRILTISNKKNVYKYQLILEHSSPAVNRLFFKEIDKRVVNNPLTKKYHYYGSENSVSSFLQQGYPYATGNEELHFRDTLHIENEIKQIKKIVTEAKESALEKPPPSLGEADIKRYIDINRISDQVYRNIERTIRMERDRRGM